MSEVPVPFGQARPFQKGPMVLKALSETRKSDADGVVMDPACELPSSFRLSLSRILPIKRAVRVHRARADSSLPRADSKVLLMLARFGSIQCFKRSLSDTCLFISVAPEDFSHVRYKFCATRNTYT